MAYASRAPQEQIRDLQARMGWEHIPWYTITDAFDADMGVGEQHIDRTADVAPLERARVKCAVQHQPVGEREQDRRQRVGRDLGQLARRHRLLDPRAHEHTRTLRHLRHAPAYRLFGQQPRPQVGADLHARGVLAARQHRLGEAPHPLDPRRTAACDPRQLIVERRGVIVEQRQQQIVLLLEVPVERALAHARLGAHVIDGQIAETADRGAPPGGLNQLLAALDTGLGTKLWHEPR